LHYAKIDEVKAVYVLKVLIAQCAKAQALAKLLNFPQVLPGAISPFKNLNPVGVFRLKFFGEKL